MKKLLLGIGLFLFAVCSLPVNAQNIIDAEDDYNFNNFYEETLSKGKKAMPYAYLRESDVVWKTAIWRNVDFREKFNQFFYYPVETESNTQGRINILNTVVRALKNGEIEVFEDDDMKIPVDGEKAISSLKSPRTTQVYVGDDEFSEPIFVDSTVYDEFDPAHVYLMMLKEFWYVDKNDTRQKVRITGMSFEYEQHIKKGDEEITNLLPLFWVPMNDMRVRNVLVKVNAYDENNISNERSYDQVFIDRYFDSYVTRESNRFNRKVSDYLTGTDAIIESQMIEDKIFDIESDMWEY